MTIGDFIFEVSLPNYIHELLEKIYKETRDLSKFNIDKILSLINEPGRTILTISRDKKRALNFRKKIETYIRKK